MPKNPDELELPEAVYHDCPTHYTVRATMAGVQPQLGKAATMTLEWEVPTNFEVTREHIADVIHAVWHVAYGQIGCQPPEVEFDGGPDEEECRAALEEFERRAREIAEAANTGRAVTAEALRRAYGKGGHGPTLN